MKQLSSRVFTKLPIEWKTDGSSTPEVRILHRGAGVGRGEEEIAGRTCNCTQPFILPSLLPKGRGNIASRKWNGRCGFIGNWPRFAILLLGLCAPTFSRAACHQPLVQQGRLMACCSCAIWERCLGRSDSIALLSIEGTKRVLADTHRGGSGVRPQAR